MTRSRFIRGILGLAFTAAVSIRGAAQDTAAGGLWRRVPSVIRIKVDAGWGDIFSGRAEVESAIKGGSPDDPVKYEVIEETEEPGDSDIRFRITLYDPKTSSFIAERVR